MEPKTGLKTRTVTAEDTLVNRKPFYQAVKRIQDVVLSVLALVVLFPFLLLIGVMIVLDDPHGGPIFTQIRSGLEGREFRLYKFRTMCVDAEQRQEELRPYNEMTGPVFKIRDDPRITRFGRFLRRTGLDELPQLINIIKGDMSIVGPRPLPVREAARCTPYQRKRQSVKPGLTCFWQVQPDRNSQDFDSWVEMDLRYIREQSWLLDWKLIFLTIGAVIGREGA